MINPVALYNEIMSGIVSSMPPMLQSMIANKKTRQAQQPASAASEEISNAMNALSSGGSAPLSFADIYELYRKTNQSGDELRQQIDDAILGASMKYGMDPNLIKSVIRAESNFNPDAVSRAGAQGLMQLMPNTAASLGVNDPFDIIENVDGGTKYLSKMLEMFGGDLRLALAAYNAGPTAVKKYDGIPPYEETQNYVPSVLGYREQYIVRQYEEARKLPRA